MNNIHIEKIVVKALPGSVVGKCIKEALVLALEQNNKVELIHNNNPYTIYPEKVIAKIYCENQPVVSNQIP